MRVGYRETVEAKNKVDYKADCVLKQERKNEKVLQEKGETRVSES